MSGNSQKLKERQEKHNLAVFFIFVFPLLGILLMWFWTTWSVKRKLSITIVYIVILTLLIFYAYSMLTTGLKKEISIANNNLRQSDTTQILNAITNYYYINNKFPNEINSNPKKIAKTGADLCAELTPEFIPRLPIDPSVSHTVESSSIEDCNSSYDTGYEVFIDENNRIIVSAPLAENQATISAMR